MTLGNWPRLAVGLAMASQDCFGALLQASASRKPQEPWDKSQSGLKETLSSAHLVLQNTLGCQAPSFSLAQTSIQLWDSVAVALTC